MRLRVRARKRWPAMLAASAAAVAMMVGLVPVAQAASVTKAADQRTVQVSTNGSQPTAKALARTADGTPAKTVTTSDFRVGNATAKPTTALATRVGTAVRQLTGSFAAEPWSNPYQVPYATGLLQATNLNGSTWKGAPWTYVNVNGPGWLNSISISLPQGYNAPAQWNRNVSQDVTQYVHFQWQGYGYGASNPSGQYAIKSWTAYWDASKQLVEITIVNKSGSNGLNVDGNGYYKCWVEVIPTQQQYDERYPGADQVASYTSVTGGGYGTSNGVTGIYAFGPNSKFSGSGFSTNFPIPAYPIWDSTLTINKTWNSTETKPNSVTVCVFQNASPDTPNVNGTGTTNTPASSSAGFLSTSDASTDRTCSASGTNNDYD
ncbi:MAG: hypothetical protein U0K19_01230, partial [Bifidobacteriaceae bacterium]|nr:hypothetical protein [Bifidobacteriaceae bacterium]